TGFAAVERADIALGDTVLVQGSGPVGLAAAAFAALRGAAAVLVIGAPRARLDLALRLGADDAIDVSTTSGDERQAWIAERTGGRGADVVIEATGSPAAVPEGLRLVRDGGTYVVAGHYTDAGEVGVNPHSMVNRKHVVVRGQWGTDFRHVARALRLLAKHAQRLPFRDIIGMRYPLDAAQEALEDVAALRVTKALIVP
ncbi:MAG TPA: zinc-binding dehydrogenase, partial [Longimicrobiales bacterium]|nr:zinc-binding dehydrogenase [Longimicrobiales bacterium]